MKAFTQIVLLGFVMLLFGFQANAQSKPFSQSVIINTANGITLPAPMKIILSTKTPDITGKGLMTVFDGPPTQMQAHNDLFDGGNPKGGKFFVTGQSDDPIPVIMSYSFYGGNGGLPYFDAVTVTTGDINNEVGLVKPKVTTTTDLFTFDYPIKHSFSYNFDRRIVENNTDTGNSRLLIFRFYKTINNNSICLLTVVLPIAIYGISYEYLGHAVEGPYDLITILRSAPGDQSHTDWEKQDVITREINWSISNGRESGSSNEYKAEVGASFGGVSAGGSITEKKDRTYSNTNSEGNTHTVSYSVTNGFSNYTKSDRFIARQLEVDFIAENRLNLISSPGSPNVYLQKDHSILMYPTGINDELNRTKDELMGNGVNSISALKLANKSQQATFWENVIKLNDEIINESVRRTRYEGPRTGTYSSTTSNARSFSQDISFSSTRTLTIEANAGIELGPISANFSAKHETSLTLSTSTSSGNINSTDATKTVGYEIADDEEDDVLVYYIKEDPVFGTPIFELVEGSSTSCPYEGGERRDNLSIMVKDPITATYAKTAKYSDLEANQEVTFELEVKNMSDEARTYRLKVSQENNTIEASYTFDPGPANNTYENMPPAGSAGSTKLLDIKIMGSKYIAYPNIAVIFEPECDPSSADTVFLSAFYGGSDTNRAPDNNFVQEAILISVDGIAKSQYTTKFGDISNITNKNAQSSPEEQVLVPEVDCYYGWCAEENGLPLVNNSVWFKFVAIVPSIEINLCDGTNNGFNSQMAVYSTPDINNFNSFYQIGANDNSNYCTNPNAAKIYLENLTIGDTLYVLVDGFQGAQNDFSITAIASSPANDGSCNPQTLTFGGTRHFSNYSATVVENEQYLIPESKDPVTGWKEDGIQHSVWFRFTGPSEGQVNIDITNATFDSQISVYRDDRVCDPVFYSQFVNLAANDDPSALGGGLNSRLELRDLVKNGNYYILVDGYQGAMGSFDIGLTIPIPGNDEPCDAITLEVDAQGQGPFMNGGATATAAEQAIAPSYVEAGQPNGWTDQPGDSRGRQIEHSLWFKFVAPPGGAVEVNTWNQTNFITQIAVYKVGKCDNFTTYTLIGAEDNSKVRQAPPDNDYPNGHGVRGSILSLTNLTPDSTYYLIVDGSLKASGTFSIDILTSPASPPSNDLACNAISLPANGVVQTGYTNLGATPTETEYKIVPPQWEDGTMNGTVWFKFVAPSSGEAEISTCDMANFDTQIAVFSVPNCAIDSTKILIAANEDGPANCSTNGDSYLPVPGLSAGQTYYIVVDGYGNNRGNFNIVIRDQITPGPVNDEVTSAILLPVNGVVQTGFTNSLATASPAEQAIHPADNDCITGWCDDNVDNSVWFKFVAPANGIVNISTCNLAEFDTQLALYEVSDVNNYSTFTLIAANDAGPEDCATFFDSYLPVEGLTAGKTYYVMVDGFDGDNGNFDISLSSSGGTYVIDINNPDDLKIYPNPFDRFISMEFSNTQQIVESVVVSDITGRKLMDISNPNQLSNGFLQIDLSSLPSGMLFVIVKTSNGIINKKLIKY